MNQNELLAETESLCPECLCKIPARKTSDSGNVYLEKDCPQHGSFKTLIWRGDAASYQNWSKNSIPAVPSKSYLVDSNRGCPFDCGLCPEHMADTCNAIMEVSHRCNLNCPVCFASSTDNAVYDPDMSAIRGMYQTLLDTGGPYPVQLSGGEPTIRDDLHLIVAIGKQMGFKHIQINTNGIRIAEDIEYLQQLKDSGASVIYLQFDGVSEKTYLYTRGASLLESKIRAVENCAKIKMGVILVPVITPGINDNELGAIVEFARKRIPIVKGVHFQPVSYFGRYPITPQDKDRITIPDVLAGLETQTSGRIKVNSFIPRRCDDTHCAFSSLYILTEEGKLLATTNFDHCQSPVTSFGQMKSTPAEQARKFVNNHWVYKEVNADACSCENTHNNLLKRAQKYYLSITGMPFQDVWNIDLERLKRCCTHVVTPNRQMIPLCAYYLTSRTGKRLYSQGTSVNTRYTY